MKKLQENPVYKRQIELLKKKYEIDDEAKIMHISLDYDKVSDLFLNQVGYNGYHEISNDVIDTISNSLGKVPLGYKANIEFRIQDYENYKAETVMESLNDSFEEKHYNGYGESRKKSLQIAFLLLAGILLLILKVSVNNTTWIQDGMAKEIFLEIIEISGWVFIWESVSILFLSPSEEHIRSIRYKRKLNSISFLDKENNMVFSESSQAIFASWLEEQKIHKVEKYALLIGGTGLMGVGFSSIISGIATANSMNWNEERTATITAFITAIMIAIFYILSGLAAISTYSKRWKIRNHLTFFGTVNCIIVIIEVSYIIYTWVTGNDFSVKTLFNAIFSFIFNFFYMVGFITNLRLNNFKKKKKD